MRDRKIASRYAQALLEALPELSARQTAGRFLEELSAAMESTRQLRDRLLDPAVPRTARKAALAGLARERGLPGAMESFLAVIVDHGRTADLPTIAEVYRERLDELLGIVPARVTTAAPLPHDLRQRAQRALETRTGRQVQLTYDVDPDLIGGAVTRIGSTVYDDSLRTQLARLRRRMIEG